MALSFIKQGMDSAKLAQQAEQEAEMRRESQGKLWRFFLGEIKGTGKYDEAKVTFIDGDLSPEGYLIPPRWYEHTLMLNGNWDNVVCPQKTDPQSNQGCPLCETGDRATLVAAFTVIDHRSYKGKNGTLYQNVRKLFIAKPQTFEILNKMAVKREGLSGCTFDVSRTGDKSASVGNVFDFCDKKSIEELKSIYQKEVTDPKTNAKTKMTYFLPAEYEVEVVYRTADELRKLGIGAPISAPMMSMGNAQTNKNTDYSNQL